MEKLVFDLLEYIKRQLYYNMYNKLLKNYSLPIYLARVTVELHIFSRMTLTENWFVYR